MLKEEELIDDTQTKGYSMILPEHKYTPNLENESQFWNFGESYEHNFLENDQQTFCIENYENNNSHEENITNIQRGHKNMLNNLVSEEVEIINNIYTKINSIEGDISIVNSKSNLKQTNNSNTNSPFADTIDKKVEVTEMDCNISPEFPETVECIPKEISSVIREAVPFPKEKLSLKREIVHPLEVFHLTFTRDLLDFIAEQSNNYAKVKGEETSVTRDDIQNYFFILIYASVVNLPEMGLYWSQGDYFSSAVSRVMTFKRFKDIGRILHVCEDESLVTDPGRAHKIDYVVNYVNERWRENYAYSNFLTVDECMAAFEGRVLFKQYIKSKRKRWGIKFFAKCGAFNSYVYELVPYTGRHFNYDKEAGLGQSVIQNMMAPHSHAQTHFTFDNFYANMNVAAYAHRNNIHFTCTVNTRRRGFPKQVKEEKVDQGNNVLYRVKDTDIHFLIHNNSGKQVCLASNLYNADPVMYYNSRRRYIEKPEMIYAYNKTKAGVDNVDSITSRYSCQRKTYKWWKSALFYVLDICINNSAIIYFENTGVKSNSKSLHYRTLIYQAVFSNYLSIPNSKFHFPVRNSNSLECKQCKKFRIPGQKNVSRTIYTCSNCKYRLCISCFEAFHK